MLDKPPADQREADQIRAELSTVTVPVDHTWLMARIGALLHPYYAGRAPAAAIDMMAEDWSAALSDFPQWAVTRAVRWWKSADNPDRRRKPLEGDIADRCRTEMGIVRVAEGALRRYDQGVRPKEAEPERQPPTHEEMERRRAFANEVMAGLPDSMKPPKPQSEEAENVGQE